MLSTAEVRKILFGDSPPDPKPAPHEHWLDELVREVPHCPSCPDTELDAE